MNQVSFAWPGGKAGALTTSWDDGTIHDRRLIDILNRHGLKGTWNLNSGRLAPKGSKPTNSCVGTDEVRTLYAGHEVACHSVTHPCLNQLPDDAVAAEILEDRRALESLAGYPVRGMSLPYGVYDARVLGILRHCGILYVRPVIHRPNFSLPADFTEWAATCHHKDDLTSLWGKFRACNQSDKLFYLWGHSYEFDNDKNWEHIESFAALAGGTSDIWFATNMQVYDYVTAWRRLQCSLEVTSIRNPSAERVWFRVGGDLRSMGPGETGTITTSK